MSKITLCAFGLVIIGLIVIFALGSPLAGGVLFVLGAILLAVVIVLDRVGEVRRAVEVVRKHSAHPPPPR